MPTALELDDVIAAISPRLARLAGHLCRTTAADALQEALHEIARSWPTFRGEAEATTWAHRVAVRALSRHSKRHRRQHEREPRASDLDLRLDEAALAGFAADPFTAAAAAERRSAVHRAIDALSPPLRDVLLLRAIDGLDYAAIADALELPLGTVKSRIAAATLRLAEALQVHGAS